MTEPTGEPAGGLRPPFRKIPLYTFELTPRFEVPEELGAILDKVLEDAPVERKAVEDVYPWFFCLADVDQASFVEYCEELDCLHEDLEFALFDLDTALDFSYEDFYFQRLALIYHVDNVDLRVHAYREKVFKLIDCFLGREKGRQDVPGGDFHKKVLDGLAQRGLGRVVTLLNRLGRDFTISSAIDRRNLFVHGRARREWPLTRAKQRIDEHISEPGPVASAEQYANFVALRADRHAEIDAICQRLAQFRYELITQLRRTTA